MSQGTKYETKAELLSAIQALVYTNQNFETSADDIQTSCNDIVESLWGVNNSQPEILQIDGTTAKVATTIGSDVITFSNVTDASFVNVGDLIQWCGEGFGKTFPDGTTVLSIDTSNPSQTLATVSNPAMLLKDDTHLFGDLINYLTYSGTSYNKGLVNIPHTTDILFINLQSNDSFRLVENIVTLTMTENSGSYTPTNGQGLVLISEYLNIWQSPLDLLHSFSPYFYSHANGGYPYTRSNTFIEMMYWAGSWYLNGA